MFSWMLGARPSKGCKLLSIHVVWCPAHGVPWHLSIPVAWCPAGLAPSQYSRGTWGNLLKCEFLGLLQTLWIVFSG